MHTYRKVRQDGGKYIYVVGFHALSEGTDDFTSLEDFSNENDARSLVNFLNGGTSIQWMNAK